MYNFYHNMVPDYLHNITPKIRYDESMYVTRQQQNFSIPKYRLNIYKSSFVPVAIDAWKTIPLEIRQSSSLTSFKNVFKNSKITPPSFFQTENVIGT